MHTVIFKQEKASKKLSRWELLKGLIKKPLAQFHKHEVVFFDHPDELPHRRFSKFNSYFMVDLEGGATVADYNKRMQRGLSYIAAEDCKSAMQEFTNQMNCLHHAIENYSPKGLALATMVHSINGVIYRGYKDHHVEAISNMLNDIGFTQRLLEEALIHIKKKYKTD